MVLGAVWCSLEKTKEISARLREIKLRHNLSPNFEIKWTKVSPAKLLFYQDLIDYFFDDDDLHFRALVVPDKSRLRHQDFSQNHDTWYYKMYFDMLKVLLYPTCTYRIYLDIKDTRSSYKITKLHDVLCNNMYDFKHEIITRIQTIRSHEAEQLQLADLLIGAVSYINRELAENKAKLPMIKGKEATFWHIISEGAVESERLPDLRRCERVRWPRAIITAFNSHSDVVKYWRNRRKSEERVILALDDFSYIVVLADRGKYMLLWTAYCVEREHQKNRLRREYEDYVNSKADAVPKDGIVTPSTHGR